MWRYSKPNEEIWKPKRAMIGPKSNIALFIYFLFLDFLVLVFSFKKRTKMEFMMCLFLEIRNGNGGMGIKIIFT